MAAWQCHLLGNLHWEAGSNLRLEAVWHETVARKIAVEELSAACHRRYHDPVVTAVEERLELWTHMNLSHQEDVQILRYSDGEKCVAPGLAAGLSNTSHSHADPSLCPAIPGNSVGVHNCRDQSLPTSRT